MRALSVVAGALLVSALGAHAMDEEGLALLFKERGHGPSLATTFGELPDSRQRNALLVAGTVGQMVGQRWVSVALRITRVESGYRCEAKNRRSGAEGLGQLMFGSARALEPGSEWHRSDCQTGARLIALHMRACVASGVTTDQQMAECHVAGPHGWRNRLAHWAQKYKLAYARMVDQAVPIRVADANGWLVRGTTSIREN